MSTQAAKGAFAPSFILNTEGKIIAQPAGAAQESGLAAFEKALFSHVAKKDLAAYSAADKEQAADLAARALAQWKHGETEIHLEKDCLNIDGEKVSILTLVNTNKPFLFDSVLGEIYSRNRENGRQAEAFAPPSVYCVMHPVFEVKRESGGNLAAALPGAESETEARSGGARVSLIQVHLQFSGEAQADALLAALRRVAEQVRLVFHDRRAMEQAVKQLSSDYDANLPAASAELRSQILEFPAWLLRGNFIFLGAQEYALIGGEKLQPAAAPLGILKDESVRVLPDSEAGETSEEILSFMRSDDVLLVTKARSRSLVHRGAFLDYLGFKLFDDKGAVKGGLRIVGLFTANAYHASVLHIPYLRLKAEAVIKSLGYDKADHSGRALLHILETYPRDDMFRLSADDLAKNAEAILELGERPRIRVLENPTRFGHFTSLLVFVPRDHYNTQTRRIIGKILMRLFEGDFYEFSPRFFDENLTRVHYIIHRQGGAAPQVAADQAEAEITAAISTWGDRLSALAKQGKTAPQYLRIAKELPQAYQDWFSPRAALRDAVCIAGLSKTAPLYVDFEEQNNSKNEAVKLFHCGGALELSRRVPVLENMGFRVISERTIEIPYSGEKNAAPIFLHDMELEGLYPQAGGEQSAARRANLAEMFKLVWARQMANDGFNALAQSAGFSLAAVHVMRSYGRYMQQAGIPYTQDRLAASLNRYPALANALYRLFCLKFAPAEQQTRNADRAARSEASQAQIEKGLLSVPALDDDRIIRAFRNLIEASVRTNAFAADENERGVKTLAFKFDPHKIESLPEPRPYREIFVYGPTVEGVHLRFGPVARGGIRWSDRGQDYRTEVLGLVKAQQVKNAVIVPVGAKGGFYPHYLPQTGDRAAVAAEGLAAYKTYIAAMLSITDNIIDGKMVPAPQAQIRHDGDDPYFVVAADKGTASFSDTANAISQANHFWLDDAFASGGSEGYDHKKMGITAKGAWEAVKRHFREMNHNIQAEEFTAAGVGDMSGDVFGNGMLLSPKMKLVAAFDHRDIFIDPNPDCALSHAERARLFTLPRSSWQDYDKSKISAGGGVFSRAKKHIELSKEAADAIGFAKRGGAPYEIISAILRAPVDLLFFGGIGTYIRGGNETDAQAGDRANDPVRITGREIRAKVIGEGANLGMTQNGRIEYARSGGRLNTDAIDNSAGVNCSDVEVNIKIAFTPAVASGKLKRDDRNALLKAMTGEVSELILRNNYLQTLALSLAQRQAKELLPAQMRFMNRLEKRRLLDRKVEALPDNRILLERQEKGEGLTRPEMAVLLAYAKNTLEAELVNSALVNDDYCEDMLFGYFPQMMREKFAAEIRGHQLRREIIATVLANDIVNRGGATFVSRLEDKTGQTAEDVLRAYIIVRDGFNLPALYAEIDALDNKIPGDAQNAFYGAVSKMLFKAAGWVMRNGRSDEPLRSRIETMRDIYRIAGEELPELLPDYLKARLASAADAYEGQGAPKALAEKLARLELAEVIPDIILIARQSGSDFAEAAHCWFALAEMFGILPIEAAIAKMTVWDYYDSLAMEQAQNLLAESLRKISLAVLAKFGGAAQPAETWREQAKERADDVSARMQALQANEMSISRLTVAAGLLAELAADCA